MTRRTLVRQWPLGLVAVAALLVLGALIVGRRPAVAASAAGSPSSAVVVLAGGCYWGVESVFDHVRGVRSATSGFATPAAAPGASDSGAAEAVRVVYDPAQISFRQILTIFFTVVHDPTQLNRQGPDVGTEYRSVVFVANDAQRQMVGTFIDSLRAAHAFARPIVTEIAPLRSFERVEASQQHYAERHPTDRYIVVNDVSKVQALKRRFPRLYRG